MNTRFLNIDASLAIKRALEDPIQRNLVHLAVFKATVRIAPVAGMSEREFLARLPSSDFDLGFFTSVMVDVFSDLDLLRRVLDGQSLAEASGWPED